MSPSTNDDPFAAAPKERNAAGSIGSSIPDPPPGIVTPQATPIPAPPSSIPPPAPPVTLRSPVTLRNPLARTPPTVTHRRRSPSRG
jgi:hypothetical protein